MDAISRIERMLGSALAYAGAPGAPPRLAAAMHHSVFPAGARIRPRLCLAVAGACGEDDHDITDAAAASIELLHCASLVHDDLPCFDDAATRRGRPSVHALFGAPLAVLAGDALIVLSFQTLARGAVRAPVRLASLILTVGQAVGMPAGIAAGQAWECEPDVDVALYQRQKTGALFAAATVAGAVAAGADPMPWRVVGERLGEAYQVADDICDMVASAEDCGKPTGQDCVHGRPNMVAQLGVAGAMRRLDELAEAAADSIPPCPGAAALRALTRQEARRLLPKDMSRHAA
jgi:geranylgeranyl diphosphate synthase type II